MDAFNNLANKFFAIVSAIIIALTASNMVITPPNTEDSTKLSQTKVVLDSCIPDSQLKDFYANMENGFTIPGLQEGFVPQGIFFDEAHQVFLVSGYYNGKTMPSRIVVVDNNGNFVKSVGAVSSKGNKAYGHFGGVAVYKDNVYVATTTVTHVLSLGEILAADDDDYVLIQGELYTDVTCSYVNVCDDVMYIGEYKDKTVDGVIKSPHKTISKSGEIFFARCNAFELDENGRFGIKSDKIDAENFITPDYTIATDLKVQGMAKLQNGMFAFTSSVTSVSNSKIYVYNDVTAKESTSTVDINSTDVPLYFCTRSQKVDTLKVPPMIEEMALYPDGSVYILSESAASAYRERTKNPIDFAMKWNILSQLSK
ncbi:MAG: hypothetical protein NC110_02375 [Ruminococcus sp.]|nr:hypothetical protein [Ruminococcus sp.]